MRAPLCVTTVSFFFFFLFLLSCSYSILSSPEILTVSSNQTLVSPGKLFELGLFKPNKSNSHWYLGIWYKEDQNRTILWVANRDIPLNTPVGTLQHVDNLLVLFDQDNSRVWWTSLNVTREGASSGMVAELLDNGNFVMKDSSDPERYLWQSFDSPTDTLLPQMKLIMDSSFLIPWSSPEDPAESQLLFGIRINEFHILAIFVADHRIDTWNGYRFGDMPPVLELKEDSFVMKTLQRSNYSKLTIGDSGIYELYSWDSEAKKWKLSWSIMEDPCSAKSGENSCGSYSYCSKKNMSSQHSCNCIRGFYPKLEHTWNGCLRKTTLNCRGDRFNKLPNMKLPEITRGTMASGPNADVKSCTKSCLLTCSCTAFAIVKTQKGEPYCVTWKGELDDLRNYTFGGQDLYFRVAAKDHEDGKSKGMALWVIGLIVGAIIVVLIVIGFVSFYYWKKHKERREEDGKSKGMTPWVIGLIVGAIIAVLIVIGFVSFYYWKKHKGRQEESTRREIIMNELVGPVERFQFMEFRVVAEATDHFSDSNKLGQGGFGTVYKGRLADGGEIAVKRLANSSSQGMREFKNEIQAILNIRHLNLVRLLGCCFEGQEIILIYEFLENASLNHYIFDETRSSLLNWATRQKIIRGIGEGLLYLHRYTNPPIIHRDLKPSNILLGKDMIPKISDFGLAKILESDQREARTDKPVGTRGYMSEEYALHMEISESSDIFSFGVTILETITGVRNLDYCVSHSGDSLLDKVWRYWSEGDCVNLIDHNFLDSSLLEEEVLRTVQIGLLCVQPRVEDRPSTQSVVLMLQSPHMEIAIPTSPNYFYARILRGEPASSSSVGQSSSVNYKTLSRMDGR